MPLIEDVRIEPTNSQSVNSTDPLLVNPHESPLPVAKYESIAVRLLLLNGVLRLPIIIELSK